MDSGRPITFKDRVFTASDLDLIREVSTDFPALSRQELANTLCELLQWRRPGGGLKTWECKELLARLESRQELELPALRRTKPRGSRTSQPRSRRGEARKTLCGSVGDVAPVNIRLAESEPDRLLWRELVGRWHYLGCKVPFGARLRYLVEVSRPEPTVAACLQFSSPAWRMAARDAWIGWDEQARRQNLQSVVCQSRFLVLPWIKVRNLASHILSKAMGPLVRDWELRYGVRPLLAETLVEEGRFTGACYRAANWRLLGRTAGRGRMDRQHRRHGASPKLVYVLPLARRSRESLRQCGGRP